MQQTTHVLSISTLASDLCKECTLELELMGTGFQYSTLSVVQLLAAIISLGTGVLVWRRRFAFPEARLLAYALWSGFWWCCMEGTELSLTSLEPKMGMIRRPR